MSTGILGTVGGSGSLTYTPSVEAKIIISAAASNTGTVSLNGMPIIAFSAMGTASTQVYVGIGQKAVIATSTAVTAVVSTLEGN